MAETPRAPAGPPPSRTEADVPAADRAVARALLQRRVEAARCRPEWASAVSMAGLVASPESRQGEVDVWALRFIEDGILSFTDLVRRVSDERRRAEVESRAPGFDR